MQINAKTTLCAVIGNPIEHSLSPQMHNAGYEALGLHFAYVAFRVEKLKEAVEGVRALGIRGVSVTIPHKQEVMQYVDSVDPLAEKIGAVNTILNESGKLKGLNTDYTGAIRALEEKTTLQGKTVAVLGAGGAAKAIVYGLSEKGATVRVFNRNTEHGEKLAEATGTRFYDLEKTEEIHSCDIIIHATSVGMTPNTDQSLLSKEILKPSQIVMDIVYNPKETALLKNAKEAGCQIVYGYKMLLYQAVTQFELFTGVSAPVEIMEDALVKGLNK